jgi:DNA-binding winged helix-turn-helix (wHTH) protein/TolB-like protein/lipopolysaccharide biosynthesis regulator YciM
MSSENGRLREFGKFRLDAEKRVLWFEEKPVNLALKKIELLCVLTENGGEVITKEELLSRVWADSFVEESNLSRHIYVLRKTFKDFGAKDLIQTVPRRGYRFAGEVRQVNSGSGQLIIERHAVSRTLIEIQEEEKGGTGEGERKNVSSGISLSPLLLFSLSAILLVALLGGFAFWRYNKTAAVSDIKSIAVLPFQTIDGEKGNEHQGLGLADVLITRLSNIKEINVRPTSAILNFDNQDSIAFGKTLNVDAILEGTIYRTNDKVRVTARLIKTGDDSPIWAGQFEKPLQEELRLQDEIALQVVNALALNLSGGEKNALTKRYTENADAYQLYIKGRYEWNKRSWAAMNEAQRLFRNAVELDPNFALAHAGLADTLAMTVDGNQASIAVQKALELDPHLAEAHASLGFIRMFHDWNWRAAETRFKKSIELNPNYATAHQWYATLLAIEGRNSEAKAEMRRALEINPLSHNFHADLGQIYYFSREYGEAEKWCLKALEIYPDFQFAHDYLYDIYLKTGDYDKATEHFIRADKINHTFANESADRQDQLEESYEKLRKIYRKNGIEKFVEDLIVSSQNANAPYVDAMHYAFLGENEKALDNLERAFEGKGFLSAFVKADPIFDSLREEPRYREILRKMNL